MKTYLTALILILTPIMRAQAQTNVPVVEKTYQAWITTFDAPHFQNIGVLYEINDSTITLAGCKETRRGPEGVPGMNKVNVQLVNTATVPPLKPGMKKFDIESIDVIKLRKNGNTGRGVLYGALAGLFVGVALDLIMYATWKEPEKEKDPIVNLIHETTNPMQFVGSAIVIGIGCLGVGMGVGAVVGSAKISIPIHGSQELFNQNKSMLNDYSSKNNKGLEGKSFSKLSNTAKDVDGNIYPTLALGAQVWMAEDLKTLHFRDGSGIPNVTSRKSVSERHYTWSAVTDSRNLCPTGWHVPSLAEWTSLFNSLGGEYGAGRKLEENFSSTGQICQWWSTTETDSTDASAFYLNTTTVGAMFTNAAKTSELKLRCIRDN